MSNENLTCRMPILGEDHQTVTISGPREAVLRAIALIASPDLDSNNAVEVRPNPQSDDGLPWLVVDARQAASYPFYLAEVVPPRDIEPPPGWEDRAVERARREGVI